MRCQSRLLGIQEWVFTPPKEYHLPAFEQLRVDGSHPTLALYNFLKTYIEKDSSPPTQTQDGYCSLSQGIATNPDEVFTKVKDDFDLQNTVVDYNPETNFFEIQGDSPGSTTEIFGTIAIRLNVKIYVIEKVDGYIQTGNRRRLSNHDDSELRETVGFRWSGKVHFFKNEELTDEELVSADTRYIDGDLDGVIDEVMSTIPVHYYDTNDIQKEGFIRFSRFISDEKTETLLFVNDEVNGFAEVAPLLRGQISPRIETQSEAEFRSSEEPTVQSSDVRFEWNEWAKENLVVPKDLKDVAPNVGDDALVRLVAKNFLGQQDSEVAYIERDGAIAFSGPRGDHGTNYAAVFFVTIPLLGGILVFLAWWLKRRKQGVVQKVVKDVDGGRSPDPVLTLDPAAPETGTLIRKLGGSPRSRAAFEEKRQEKTSPRAGFKPYNHWQRSPSNRSTSIKSSRSRSPRARTKPKSPRTKGGGGKKFPTVDDAHQNLFNAASALQAPGLPSEYRQFGDKLKDDLVKKLVKKRDKPTSKDVIQFLAEAGIELTDAQTSLLTTDIVRRGTRVWEQEPNDEKQDYCGQDGGVNAEVTLEVNTPVTPAVIQTPGRALPDGWSEHTDQASGKKYYAGPGPNGKMQTQWDFPEIKNGQVSPPISPKAVKQKEPKAKPPEKKPKPRKVEEEQHPGISFVRCVPVQGRAASLAKVLEPDVDTVLNKFMERNPGVGPNSVSLRKFASGENLTLTLAQRTQIIELYKKRLRKPTQPREEEKPRQPPEEVKGTHTILEQWSEVSSDKSNALTEYMKLGKGKPTAQQLRNWANRNGFNLSFKDARDLLKDPDGNKV